MPSCWRRWDWSCHPFGASRREFPMLSLPGRRRESAALAGEMDPREPRTTKSFREAGDRIVRQESAVSSPIGGLLSAPALSARRAITDADAWDVRLAALATLGHYD